MRHWKDEWNLEEPSRLRARIAVMFQADEMDTAHGVRRRASTSSAKDVHLSTAPR